MAEQTPSNGLDLSMVDDPGVRRTLRTMHEQFSAALQKQEREIEAMLDVLTDKRITSMGEFRLHLQRLGQGDKRAERLHEQMSAPLASPPGKAAPARV